MEPGKNHKEPGTGGTAKYVCDAFGSVSDAPTPLLLTSLFGPQRKTRWPPRGLGKPGALGSPSLTKYTALHRF